MFFLTVLPESICLDILLNWSGLKNVVQFDSAMSSTVNRRSLLQLYEHEQFHVPGRLRIFLPSTYEEYEEESEEEDERALFDYSPYSYVGYIKWICLRNIKGRMLEIDMMTSGWEKITRTSKTDCIVISKYSDNIEANEKLQKLIKSCTRDNKRVICNCISDKINTDLLPEITDITLDKACCVNSKEIVKILSAYCRKLVAFRIDDSPYAIKTEHISLLANEYDLIELISNNPCLEMLYISLTHNGTEITSRLLNTVSENCPNLRELVISEKSSAK